RNLGEVIAAAGDFNADGLRDFIVSSPFINTEAVVGASGYIEDAGAAVIVFGTLNRDSIPVSDLREGLGGFTIAANHADANLGFALAGVGDVNGDGFSDIALGVHGDWAEAEGAVFVVGGGNFG